MTDILNWFAKQWTDFITWAQEILTALLTWFQDVFLTIFELVLDGVVMVFNALSPPEFVAGGMSGIFSALPNDITYFLGQSGLAPALAIYGAGVTFRLLRKLFTLGQW